MHKAELMKLYEFINLAYNKEPPLPTEIEMLMPLFENYSFAEMQRATQQHIKTMLSAPKPAHLIKIAEANKQAARRAFAEEEMKKIQFDSNGRQIYQCPYCQDTGWTLVDLDDGYSAAGAKCICQNIIKNEELKANGRVRLRLKSKLRRSDDYYVFDFKKMMFVREDVYAERTAREQNSSIDIKDMDYVTATMLEQLDLPF